MSEIDKLLNELRNMTAEARAKVLNNKDTWSKIARKEWEDLGFTSEEEVKEWIVNNPYGNM